MNNKKLYIVRMSIEGDVAAQFIVCASSMGESLKLAEEAAQRVAWEEYSPSKGYGRKISFYSTPQLNPWLRID